MRVELSTDTLMASPDGIADHVRSVVEIGLGRLAERITRLEVHLSDINRSRAGPDDKQCMMEARVNGLRPTAVSHRAATIEQAVNGAAHLLKRSLTSTLDRQRDA